MLFGVFKSDQVEMGLNYSRVIKANSLFVKGVQVGILPTPDASWGFAQSLVCNRRCPGRLVPIYIMYTRLIWFILFRVGRLVHFLNNVSSVLSFRLESFLSSVYFCSHQLVMTNLTDTKSEGPGSCGLCSLQGATSQWSYRFFTGSSSRGATIFPSGILCQVHSGFSLEYHSFQSFTKYGGQAS